MDLSRNPPQDDGMGSTDSTSIFASRDRILPSSASAPNPTVPASAAGPDTLLCSKPKEGLKSDALIQILDVNFDPV
jgi:hypothetical protein